MLPLPGARVSPGSRLMSQHYMSPHILRGTAPASPDLLTSDIRRNVEPGASHVKLCAAWTGSKSNC